MLPGGKPCPHFNQQYLCCDYQPKEGEAKCLYQMDPGIDDETLFQRESVPLDTRVQDKAEIVRKGVDRVSALWGEKIYDSVRVALHIASKYRPNSPQYISTAWDDARGLYEDMLQLGALAQHISTAVGDAEGIAKELEAHRKVMHGKKFHKIRESYRAGLRRGLGRITDTGVDFDVRRDPEYSQLVLDVAKAEQQASILRSHYEGLIELINAIKYQTQRIQGEYKYAGRAG